MDQNNTATPDELQQAINNITNPAETSAASVEAAVAQATGAAAPAVDLGVAPAPEVPGLETAPVEPAKAVYGDPDLDKVKSMALSDLRPILESVEIEAGKKFKIYKEIIDLTEDKACIELAYNAAKGIEDQKEKAEALLFVVEAVDKLGIPAEQAPAA